jgi:hypothetical protein
MKAALLIPGVLALSGCIRPRPSYNGMVESINCVAIQGWAFDWNRPNVPSEVAVYDGEKLVVRIKADGPRPDLNTASKNHGFLISPVPSVLFDHQPHTIHVRFGESSADLRQSPQPLLCPDH